jgi:hypothetical protein
MKDEEGYTGRFKGSRLKVAGGNRSDLTDLTDRS